MPRKSQRELDAPPPVRLVEPVLPVELPAPPPHLSPEAADWWRQTVAAYELEPHHLKILEAACDAWDRLVEARAEVLRDGPTIEGEAPSRRKRAPLTSTRSPCASGLTAAAPTKMAAVAHEAERVIDRMFQIRLWMTSIWDVQRYSPHPGNADWERAADIKRRLDEALVAVRAKQTTPAVPAPTEDAEAEAPVPADADP